MYTNRKLSSNIILFIKILKPRVTSCTN